MAFKKPTVKKTITTLNSLRIYLRSVKKFGKSTLFRDMVLSEYGDPERGMLVGVGAEMGYALLDSLNSTHVETWKDMQELKTWLIKEKGNEHNIELIAFDVVDELIPIIEKEVCRISQIETGKVCKSINSAMGGYGKGQEKVKEMLKTYFFDLYKAGFGVMAIAHTKTKNIVEKGMEESEGYTTLTSNLSNAYEGIFGDIFDCVLTGMIDREVVDGRTVATTRKLFFRGDHYVDAGCRFAKGSVPDYMIFDNEDNAPEFIEILKEGMRKSAKSPISNEEFNKRVEEEKILLKEKLAEAIESEDRQTEEDVVVNKDALLNQIQDKMKNVDTETKTKVFAIVKAEGGKIKELSVEKLQEILDIIK